MTRADLIAYAASLFGPLADEAGIPIADTATGLAYQLDAVMAATADDAAPDDAQKALIEYHTLIKIRYALAARPDFDATAIRRGRSQPFAQVNALIADAAGRAAAAGHPTTKTTVNAILLDYLETGSGDE